MTGRLALASCPSPNHGERTGGRIDILLLHYTGMPDHDQALAWLCNPDSNVSSHYFVHEDGRVLSLVPEDRRAWHAGASAWAGETDVNSRSIGVEIANTGHPGGLPDFPHAQIEAVIALCRDVVGRHPIPSHRILAHSDVAPGRKLDPGERFPWARLAGAGIGHWVAPAEIGSGRFFQRGDRGDPVEALQAMLALYGYGIEIDGEFGQRTENVVAAFQCHFRPARVDGVADRSTIETLRDLLAALP
jgi:N-acetylmuramoyl-L-alanine amidase